MVKSFATTTKKCLVVRFGDTIYSCVHRCNEQELSETGTTRKKETSRIEQEQVTSRSSKVKLEGRATNSRACTRSSALVSNEISIRT